jgi:hypothetical protein
MIKNIVITVSESYLDKLKSIADSLRKDGLTITNLYDFGVITGNAEEKIIKKLRDHKEIISLTEEKQAFISHLTLKYNDRNEARTDNRVALSELNSSG